MHHMHGRQFYDLQLSEGCMHARALVQITHVYVSKHQLPGAEGGGKRVGFRGHCTYELTQVYASYVL